MSDKFVLAVPPIIYEIPIRYACWFSWWRLVLITQSQVLSSPPPPPPPIPPILMGHFVCFLSLHQGGRGGGGGGGWGQEEKNVSKSGIKPADPHSVNTLVSHSKFLHNCPTNQMTDQHTDKLSCSITDEKENVRS